jgi:hypothetical protein
VDHPEQLALARVVDEGVGRERAAAGGHGEVGRLADLLIDGVGLPLVVEEVRDHAAERHVGKRRHIDRARAKTHTPENVLEHDVRYVRRGELSARVRTLL